MKLHSELRNKGLVTPFLKIYNPIKTVLDRIATTSRTSQLARLVYNTFCIPNVVDPFQISGPTINHRLQICITIRSSIVEIARDANIL